MEVNVQQAEDRLPELIDLAVAGEEIIIVQNGVLIARLIPVDSDPNPKP